jgi:hypothetical protein
MTKERKPDIASYRILQEFNAIVEGVLQSFGNPVMRSAAVEFLENQISQSHELLKEIGYEGKIEQFRQQVMEGKSTTLPIGALEAALADVKLLGEGAKKSPSYVRSALAQYAKILDGMLRVKEGTLAKATNALVAFSSIHSHCDKLGPRYMQSQMPNHCRPAIYQIAGELRQLKEHTALMSSLENADAVRQLEGVTAALETYQNMCGACPFRKFYQENKPEDK